MQRCMRRAVTAVAAAGAVCLSVLPSGPAQGQPVEVASQAAVAGAPRPGSAGGGDPYYPLYGNGGYDVQHYGLEVRYNPSTDRLAGVARLRVRATQSLSRFNLDLVGLTVRSIRVNDRRARWVRRSNHELVITPARPMRKGSVFTVVVRYDGKPRTSSGTSDPIPGSSGFLATSDGAIAVGEPEVAALWYPVNDHPQDKATYRISLTVPRKLQAISNGLPAPTKVRGGWATTTWRVQHPMASYLAFMAVGRFDVHTWRTADQLPIIDAVDPTVTAKVRASINGSFARQGEIIRQQSKWFGPYPFEAAGGVVDQLDLGFALENQTRPIYGAAFWGEESEPFQNDGVVVHELAHQWYGNSVALRRWKDIWLNEGFASYAEWLWAEHDDGITTAEIFDELYAAIPAGDEFWKTRPGAPGRDNLFSESVYVRGAMTLQALRQVVGRQDFFAILQAWARQRRDGNGTTEQFVALSERISGRQLDTLFNEWLYQGNKPSGWSGAGTASRRVPSLVQHDGTRDYVRSWRASAQHRHPPR